MSEIVDAETIHARLATIVAEMPAIGKGQRNQQQGFMYRGHDDVMNALNPLLSKHGVFFAPRVVERVTSQRETAKGTVLYEVNLHVEYTFFASGGGDTVVASAWGEGTDAGDKSTNKAMTMALKNVLAQVFAVSTEEHARYDTDGQTDAETIGRRVEGPKPLQPPKSWTKVTEMVAAFDQRTYETFDAFVKSASRSLFEGKDPADLKEKADKDVLFQKAAGAAVALREACDPNSVPPPTVEDVRRAFASVMDGVELAIPGEDE